MSDVATYPPGIDRTERGLVVEGTRITLYLIMDHLKADWPPKLIRDWFNLTDEQIAAVLRYIEDNREAVEAEYAEVVAYDAEIRQYWEERNREHFARIAAMPPPPGKEALYEKLQEWKRRLDTSE